MAWIYYNHARISDSPPHENADISAIQDKSIWKGKVSFLARWTTDFDCGYETKWWYVIKSDVFNIETLKAKRRYEINKGRKNFNVFVIDPEKYAKELFDVQSAAYSGYPEKYRPTINRDAFVTHCAYWKGICFGAFLRESPERLCGYAYLVTDGKYINYASQKVIPEYEKMGLNAALVYEVLMHYAKDISDGSYICDGERNVNHESAFQDYLEKYFGFRKAYCKLHIVYNPLIGWAMPILRAFQGALAKWDDNRLIHMVNAVLKMDKLTG